MYLLDDWMFNLGLSNGQILVFAYVYSCVKDNNWNPRCVSSEVLSKKMNKKQQNISTALNDLCRKGLIQHSGNSTNNCCMYSLTPKVFEVSKESPAVRVNTDTDYSEQIQKIMDAFRYVLGFDNYSVELIEEYSIPLLEAGYTVDDLCNVVRCKGNEWIDSEKMVGLIRPQTLFKPEKFDEYLSQARILNRNSIQDINLDFIYRVYSHLDLTPPEDLAKWCSKTLRENPDVDVTSLGWSIHSIYLDLKEKNSGEWLKKKMSSTFTLTDMFPTYKSIGIACSVLGDVNNMRL